jgi:molybdate transport system ATP-binding protein
MTLSVVAQLRRGELELSATLADLTGITAVVGPNGAGKSTLLRAVAGLEYGATVDLSGEDVSRLPPHLRRIGLLPADALLRPTATAVSEVAVAAKASRTAGRRAAALAALAAVGATDLGARRCGTLSSGEAARVALARALVSQPRALLLDEPLARLDAAARPAVRAALRDALASYSPPVLLVTHDVVDVAALASRVVVLEAGRLVQDCSPEELTARPRSEWAARFAGLELLRGDADGSTVALEGGGALAVSTEARGAVMVAVRASSIVLSANRPEGSARNAWPARVTGLETLGGDRVRVALSGPPAVAADVTMAAVRELALDVGVAVWASAKATDLEVYPA